MLWVASMRAMNSASRRSFLRRASAAGLCILETAATAQSRPSARLARHVEAGGAALVARPGLLEPGGPLRDLGGVGAEAAAHHLAGEGVERRGGDRSRVDVQADGGNMGHGKPPPRRCGKGYRTGRYSKPIVAPRARGKKLRRGGGGPNGFLISSSFVSNTA